MASIVAAVPPSCETPMTSPPVGGSSASSNACAAITDAGPAASPAARIASRRISTAASAACSLLPQAVATRAVLARPPPRHDAGRTTAGGLADRTGEPAGGPLRIGQSGEDPLRDEW